MHRFRCEAGRVCQRQTPGEAFPLATYLLRCLVWFPVYAFGKTGKAGKPACSKLSTTVCETVHTSGTTKLAGITGTAVSESNKTSKAGTAYYAGKTETSETTEARKMENTVSESNKETVGNAETGNAKILTG